MKTYERYFGTVEVATKGDYEYATVYVFTLDAIKAMERYKTRIRNPERGIKQIDEYP